MAKTPSARRMQSRHPGEKPERRNSFVAADQISLLDYDFSAYGGGSGDIPAPSSLQLTTFRMALSDVLGVALGDESNETPESIPVAKQIRMFSEMLGKDDTEEAEKLMVAASQLCSNSPSFEELNKQPYRVKQAFVGWLCGVFLTPEALTPATNS